jgi:hypothetical protein
MFFQARKAAPDAPTHKILFELCEKLIGDLGGVVVHRPRRQVA